MSTEDGPGIRTTVFFKQCPLRCAWCHNPETIQKLPSVQWFGKKCIGCSLCVEACPNQALEFKEEGLSINRKKCVGCGECVRACPTTALKLYGKSWTVADLYREIDKDRVYYEKSGGGVTFSGGEPTMQSEFLIEILKKCKQNGISTALDTCGLASKEVYDRVLQWTDLIMLDIKEIDSKRHKIFVGAPNEKILEIAKWLAKETTKKGMKMWIRTPLIPEYTATKKNVVGLGRFIAKNLVPGVERWDLLAFNNLAKSKYDRMDKPWPLKNVPLLTKAQMEAFYDLAINTGAPNVNWSGMTRDDSSAHKCAKKLKTN